MGSATKSVLHAVHKFDLSSKRWAGEGKSESERPGGNSRPAGDTHRQLSTKAASIRSARSKNSASTFRKTPQHEKSKPARRNSASDSARDVVDQPGALSRACQTRRT